MKKFQTHNKWCEEEHPRTQERKKSTTEEARKFSRHDSSEFREDYLEDENKSMKYSKPHSYQMERRSRTTSQAFVNTPKYEAIEQYDFKKISCGINPTNGQQDLNEANKGAKQPGYKENYKQIHQGVHPLCPNKGNDYPQYRAFKDMSEPIDTRYHDLPKNAYMHEEKSASQSDNLHDSSQRAAFSNDFASYESIGFNMLKLTDLLYYNTNLMQEHQLFEYASAVKSKILEKIDKFPNPEKEELEFLCEITDGDQSEKNQRIITARTCYIVRKVIDKLPGLLNAIETPSSSQMLVCQTASNLHGITNSYCSNESPVFEIVQNSNISLTSTTDYSLMAGIAQNDKYVISKGISDSLDIMNSNDYRDNCEDQNCRTDNAKNNSSINTSLVAEESSKYCPPSANSGICTPVQKISTQKFIYDKKKSIFHAFDLDNLLKYDVNAMHGNLVFDYGFSLKKRILENIDQFKDLYKEKLKFLSELTDGTQRVENQKLINERMIDLINDYKDEILDKPNRQNFISRNVYPSQSHYENGIVHEHRQNSDEQSRNVHTRKSYKEERVHEQRQNFSDGQARNVHSRRSHCKDEMVQNFSDRQSRNVHENRSHYEEEIIHDHRQNFSDGQSRNVHQKKSHYEDARRR